MRRVNRRLSIDILHILIFFVIVAIRNTSAGEPSRMDQLNPMWVKPDTESEKEDNADTYVAFRGEFEIPEADEIEFRLLGASWFNAWLDEEFFAEGPARFHQDYPEYDVVRINLSAGNHLLAVQVHYEGLTTRILDDIAPFFACQILKNNKPVHVKWKCAKLEGYRTKTRRINPQLGWIEWCDTRKLPDGWQSYDYDDSNWQTPVPCEPKIGTPKPLSIATVKNFIHSVTPIASGPLAEVFGYERDDIPARFFLRDLVCDQLPPQGVWRRYDLDRVRLARPRFVLDLPEGAVVEFAYNETLQHGRVSPYITLSAGPSCNLDHYKAKGGMQEFFPLTPKGGRFVEIHIFADPDKINFISEEFVERAYHDTAEGSFCCEDELLNRIWMTGIETYRACAEDALIDNPTRERGQWTGDVASVGMDIAAIVYSDIRLCRRALVQSAQCAREDGLIAGLCPGGEAYLATYAAQWISACMHYFELTGDQQILEELFPAAERNMAAFEKFVTKDGLMDGLGWVFVDWGYKRNLGLADMAYNFHFLATLRDMIRWCQLLGRNERIHQYKEHEKNITDVVSSWIRENISLGQAGWRQIGYHCAVLGLRLGMFDEQVESDCVEFIKQHILSCFPNDPTAPRNSDPSLSESRLITPYFAHYAFPPLIERGHMDFVLDQYRKCWGWALEEGRTTWIEVFDTRWSHCHQWAGCPTWQLSRYILGLQKRYDLGAHHFSFSLFPGSLKEAEGNIPLPGAEGVISIKWSRKADGIHFSLITPVPIFLHIDERMSGKKQPILKVENNFNEVFKNL